MPESTSEEEDESEAEEEDEQSEGDQGKEEEEGEDIELGVEKEHAQGDEKERDQKGTMKRQMRKRFAHSAFTCQKVAVRTTKSYYVKACTCH